MFNSIKLKLVVLSLVVFSILFAALELFLYYKLEDVTLMLADEHLKSEVASLANLMAIEEAQGQLESELQELAAAVTGVYAEKLSGHYYQIYDASGGIVVRSPSLMLGNASLPNVPGSEAGIYTTITGPKGEQLRLISQTFNFSLGPLTIIGADTLDEVEELIGSFKLIVLSIFPIVFFVSVAGIFLVTGYALRPLREFSAKVGRVTMENLSERVEEKAVPEEIRPLAANFNTMLGRLEVSFARQRQFLSDASHELRTPTSIIKSYCDVTLARERSAPDYRDAIVKVNETVNRMCDIINRILVISRFDTKSIQFKPVQVDLKEVVRDVLKLIAASAANKGVNITFEGGNAMVRGDREGLTEVVTNIIENAVKYNRPGGSVAVAIGEEGETAYLRVSDTGIGIPAEDTHRIFDRFYRVDASRTVTAGSGLGLSIVKSIVESHGGRIDVTSELGKGTTFMIRLPRRPEYKEGGSSVA